MKKILLSLAMLLTGVGAWATVENGTDVTVSQIENGVVYTIQGYRDQWRYVYSDNTNNKMASTTTTYNAELGNADDYQWTFYKSDNNFYYLYSIGVSRFVGLPSGSTIPLVENGPVSTYFIIKDSEITSATAIMMSADNGAGAIHCAQKGVISNWGSNYTSTTANVCAFKITKIGELDEAILQNIKTAVDTYEAPIVRPAKLENLNTLVTELESYENLVGNGYGHYTFSDNNYAATIDELRDFHSAQSEEDATATVAEIEEKINVANELLEACTINTPADGSFLRITRSADDNSYLIGENSTNITKFAADMGEDASSIFYYTNGKLLSFVTGKYLANASGFLNYTTTIGEAAGTTIDFINSGTAGKYNVLFNSNRYLHSSGNSNSNAASGDADANYRFSLKEVTGLPVTIGESKYATFYAPVAVTLPASGLKAYYVSETSNSTATMTEITGVIPANTGVILQGEPNTYNLTIGGEKTISGNKLLGTVAATNVTENAYVLAKPVDEEVGFYLAEKDQSNNTAFLNNGFKAYLPVAGVASARLLFDFGTETAIESIEGAENADAVVYDLAGRRVKGVQKGLYIVNGKVVIK